MPVPNGPQPGLQGQGFEHTEVKMNFDKLMEVMNEVSEARSEEHTSELQSRLQLVWRVLLE